MPYLIGDTGFGKAKKFWLKDNLFRSGVGILPASQNVVRIPQAGSLRHSRPTIRLPRFQRRPLVDSRVPRGDR